jgi:hypothetical protein
MDRAFACCLDCEVVVRQGWPAETLHAAFGDPAASSPMDRLAGEHAGHRVVRIASVDDRYASEAYGSTARVAFVETRGDDGGRYVVEVRRDAPGRPVSYRVTPGRLVRTREAITADTPAIAHLLADAGAAERGRAHAVSATLAGVVTAEGAAAGFSRLEAGAVPGPSPLVAHAPLPDRAVASILRAASRLVSQGALARHLSARHLTRLVERHASAGGAFAPVLETGYAVVGPAGSVERHLRRIRARLG